MEQKNPHEDKILAWYLGEAMDELCGRRVFVRITGVRTGRLRVVRCRTDADGRVEITAAGEGKGVDQLAYRISQECQACGACMDACPNDAISEGDIYQIDTEKCEECGSCADTCPTGAVVQE